MKLSNSLLRQANLFVLIVTGGLMNYQFLEGNYGWAFTNLIMMIALLGMRHIIEDLK